MRRGNTAFPVVFPVGGASLVASPLRSDYPSYAPGMLSIFGERERPNYIDYEILAQRHLKSLGSQLPDWVIRK